MGQRLLLQPLTHTCLTARSKVCRPVRWGGVVQGGWASLPDGVFACPWRHGYNPIMLCIAAHMPPMLSVPLPYPTYN